MRHKWKPVHTYGRTGACVCERCGLRRTIPEGKRAFTSYDYSPAEVQNFQGNTFDSRCEVQQELTRMAKEQRAALDKEQEALLARRRIGAGEAGLISDFLAFAVRSGHGTAAQRQRIARLAEHVFTATAIGNTVIRCFKKQGT